MLSHAIQDYLKAIYKLQESGQPVITSKVAKRLSVSAPSATNMLKRLARLRLVKYRRYRGAFLTPAGRKVALEVIRHHRLLERYLAEALDVSLDHVHAEAERLEHALSEELEEHIDRVLGRPTSDPHGDPIPTRDGTVRERHYPTLAELEPPRRVVVRRVSDEDPAQLRHLTDLGAVPGASVSVMEKLPFDGPMRIETGGREHVLSLTLARRLFVEPAKHGAP
ncbi:MAG: DtxR family transcriptional regulator [bacterium]